MARRVFFSFHYKRDAWRANQVRNSWVTKPDRKVAGYWDAAEWEKVNRKGEKAIKDWIDEQLKGTSVTVVLIGAETSKRKYVQYEIDQSLNKGNGIIGIYIHNIKNQKKETDTKGVNPFTKLGHKHIKTYNWVNNKGYENIGDWIESAYEKAQIKT